MTDSSYTEQLEKRVDALGELLESDSPIYNQLQELVDDIKFVSNTYNNRIKHLDRDWESSPSASTRFSSCSV